jgi:drug/metabolite transporter (DMT)-like permease
VTKSRELAYIALIVNAIIWGAAFPVVKPTLNFLTPLQFLFLRFLLASLFSLPFLLYYYTKTKLKISYTIKVLLIESIQLLALPVLYLGVSQTSALESSLIGTTSPLFVILGGIIFLGERETKREWQGLTLSLLGSLILIFEPLWNGHGFVGSNLSGNLYILLYNGLYMVYVLIAKKNYKTKPPLFLTPLNYLFATLLYGAILLFSNSFPQLENWRIYDLRIILPIIYMAIPGSIIAFAFQMYAVSKIEVSEANLFTYLHPLVSIPTAYLLLGEKPSLTTLLAILLIAYGVIRAEVRTK